MKRYHRTMNDILKDKNIVLGITGSIAAYKSAELVRRLREWGANVRVVMTNNAKRFITPLTMQALSGFPVHDDLFDLHAEAAMGHIDLARWADLILVAPASANFIAQLAHGHAENLLSTLCLATKAPIMIAPAMNQNMWSNASTQQNIKLLIERNVHVLETDIGKQACGDFGEGRLLDPEKIIVKVTSVFNSKELSGTHVLITAGPTHESLDPVRYLANGSSGKMGYALAQAAYQKGAKVTLISGPVNLRAPAGIDYFPVTSAQEMSELVLLHAKTCQIFMGVAAVSDYRPLQTHEHKIHKKNEVITLQLQPNPDIIFQVAQLQPKPFIVGFAAETQNVLETASQKRKAKNMDIIVANYVAKGVGIGSDDNEVIAITNHSQTNFAKMNKTALASQLINLIIKEYRHVTC